MKIDDAEKQRQGVGVFESNVVVVGQIPKNTQYEIRVTFKDVAAGHRQKPARFVDMREYWFREGPTEEPVPTKKGVMIKTESVPELMILLLRGLEDGSIGVKDAKIMKTLLDKKALIDD